MRQKVLWANHTSSKATWGNQVRDESQISTFICDINAYFLKTYKFQGRNSLRVEDYNNPTLTHIYLFKSYLFI